MTSEHTPTPWGFNCGRIVRTHENKFHELLTTGIANVEHFPKKQAQANAAFIVKSANSHEQLLKCLKRWEEYATANLYSENEGDSSYCSFLKDCRRLFAAHIARRNAFIIHFNQKAQKE